MGGTTYAGTYDDHDRLTDWDAFDFTYNDNGEMTEMADTSDTTTYTWDAWGRLKTVTLPNSDVVTYAYDGKGRKAEVYYTDTSVPSTTLQYVLLYQSGLKPVAQMDSSGDIIARFIWGAKANVPEYMVKGSDTYRLITDPRGSVRLVMDISDGSIAQQIDYDEWGHVTNDTSPGFQPFGFAGGLYDYQTDLVNFGARHYSGMIGRWLSKDPIGFDGGDTNLYGYVMQDPVNFVDNTGLEAYQIGVNVSGFLGSAGGSAEAGIAVARDPSTNGYEVGVYYNGEYRAGLGYEAGGSLAVSYTPGATSLADLNGLYGGPGAELPGPFGGQLTSPANDPGIGPTYGGTVGVGFGGAVFGSIGYQETTPVYSCSGY